MHSISTGGKYFIGESSRARPSGDSGDLCAFL